MMLDTSANKTGGRQMLNRVLLCLTTACVLLAAATLLHGQQVTPKPVVDVIKDITWAEKGQGCHIWTCANKFEGRTYNNKGNRSRGETLEIQGFFETV
jgi:hypothetical protein